MNLNDWLTIIGALGGLEAIKWIVNFFVNHRTNARKENASADGLEDEIARVMSEKIKRDEKVDYLYIELRKSEEKALKLTSEKHELEMCLKEAEMKKCNVHGCTNRVPPSDY